MTTLETSTETNFDSSCTKIERTLGIDALHMESSEGLYIERGLYVVKQGSAVVTVTVLPTGTHHHQAVVRVYATVASEVSPNPQLFQQLLILNARLRFGSFAYEPKRQAVLFGHTLLGGPRLETSELLAAIHDVAIISDAYDDRIVARYGGKRMTDVIEESAWNHMLQQADTSDEEL